MSLGLSKTRCSSIRDAELKDGDKIQKEIDSEGIPQFGLVAEDVEKINPDLVVRDKNGELLSVRYEQINAMLLNEFLKSIARSRRCKSKLKR